jgi:hypothetical protein
MKREIIKVSWDEISFMAMKLIYTVSNTLSLVNWVMKPPLRLTLVHSNLEVKPPSYFRFTGQKVALGLNLHPSQKKRVWISTVLAAWIDAPKDRHIWWLGIFLLGTQCEMIMHQDNLHRFIITNKCTIDYQRYFIVNFNKPIWCLMVYFL